MKTFTTTTLLTAAFSLLYTTNAATVTLQTTQCIQPVELQTFDVTLGELSRGVNSTCGLKILSTTPTSSLKSITCRAFRDTAGTVPGSAEFTFDNPALISTNPVEEGSILCRDGTASNGTITARTTAAPTNKGNGTITLTTMKPTGKTNATGISVTATAPTSTFTGAGSKITGLGVAAGLAGMVALVL